jgi:aspartate/methionine/tyrosine aminotransferase
VKLPTPLLSNWMSAFEFATPPIRYNLASSTGPTWTFGELLALDAGELRAEMQSMPVAYAPVQGTSALRQQIARLHHVDPDWVVVTTGASEALSLLLCVASDSAASVVLPSPGYPATEGMALAYGLKIRPYLLEAAHDFRQDKSLVLSAVDSSTRLVVVNTPHNPTGSVMAGDQVRELAQELAERSIPLVLDEVFHRLYFGNEQSSAATLPGTIVVGDMSKCLSLPGLRIGWIIDADSTRRERLIEARDHFSISGSPLMEAFAALALREHARFLDRLAAGARANLASLEQFIRSFRSELEWVKPAGGTLSFPWFADQSDSTPWCEAWAKAGVLIVPGSTYGMPAHFRVGYGLADPVDFNKALALMADVLVQAKTPGASAAAAVR